jgi:hypothetical protein
MCAGRGILTKGVGAQAPRRCPGSDARALSFGPGPFSKVVEKRSLVESCQSGVAIPGHSHGDGGKPPFSAQLIAEHRHESLRKVRLGCASDTRSPRRGSDPVRERGRCRLVGSVPVPTSRNGSHKEHKEHVAVALQRGTQALLRSRNRCGGFAVEAPLCPLCPSREPKTAAGPDGSRPARPCRGPVPVIPDLVRDRSIRSSTANLDRARQPRLAPGRLGWKLEEIRLSSGR